MSGPTIATQLAEWAIGLSYEDLPAPVRRAARRHLVDGFGTALAAARTRVVSAASTVARDLAGPCEATILGTADRVSAPAAALANGALVHGLDYDDTHAGGLVHATAIALPAALAVGEQFECDGRELLTAAVVGYEVICRVAMSSPHGFHARGLHATHVAGTLAAAAVAAKLAKADAAVTTNALGIAGSSSGGLLEFLNTGASTKQLHPGAATMSGILAARLAVAGATGPATVIEGPYGIYAALSAREADPDAVVAGLGMEWESTRITIKPYPSCQLMHSTLDAVRGLPSIAADEIAEVTAFVHPDSAGIVSLPADAKLVPRTPYDAKFSLPWSVAALLIDGDIGLSTYEPASIARPAVLALAPLVRTILSEGSGAAADAPGRVEVRRKDGRVFESTVPHSSGGPESPLTDEELMAKFTSNTGVAGKPLADAVFRLGDDPTVNPAFLARAAFDAAKGLS